jgi:hypothetical protein
MRKNHDFSTAVRNPYAKRLKRQLTIRLDEETIEYFQGLSREMSLLVVQVSGTAPRGLVVQVSGTAPARSRSPGAPLPGAPLPGGRRWWRRAVIVGAVDSHHLLGLYLIETGWRESYYVPLVMDSPVAGSKGAGRLHGVTCKRLAILASKWHCRRTRKSSQSTEELRLRSRGRSLKTGRRGRRRSGPKYARSKLQMYVVGRRASAT